MVTLRCDPDALVALVRAGDIQALDRMTRCHGERLLAVGRRHCGDEEKAKDAVQDALLSAGEHLADFRGEGSVEGWLVRMVTNACRRFHRGRKNDPSLHTTALEILDAPGGAQAADSPEAQAMRGQMAGALGDALLGLDARDRVIVLLADGEGWKGPEIARRLEMTPVAVRARLSRARKRLRQTLGPEWAELS